MFFHVCIFIFMWREYSSGHESALLHILERSTLYAKPLQTDQQHFCKNARLKNNQLYLRQGAAFFFLRCLSVCRHARENGFVWSNIVTLLSFFLCASSAPFCCAVGSSSSSPGSAGRSVTVIRARNATELFDVILADLCSS